MHVGSLYFRLGEDDRRKFDSYLFIPSRRETEPFGIQTRDRRQMPDHDVGVAKRLTLKITYSGYPFRGLVMEGLVIEDKSLG